MKGMWWKLTGVILVFYAIYAGFTVEVPALPILHETIRNLFFHVTMWFGMMILMLVSMIYSIKFLSSSREAHDVIASEAAHVGMLFGAMGIVTGMIWAYYTWGDWWVKDPKLNGAAVSMLVYLAYFVLRGSMEDPIKKAKVAAVYNIFAFVLLIVFIKILPDMTDSLHPGNGGNPGFNTYDTTPKLKMVFYPAIIGWTLIGVWIVSLKVRLKNLVINRLINQ
ncbi:MAG: cytochrome c biogenesis protein CcsA [Flavobacteriales bacterium]|nr:cytochrome c biogenesis protein CcsA [Flavobacteriales bacterium]MBL4735790.1 cytochrome c biogenesis protein CcsA [Flavobacteriales bacterium]